MGKVVQLEVLSQLLNPGLSDTDRPVIALSSQQSDSDLKACEWPRLHVGVGSRDWNY